MLTKWVRGFSKQPGRIGNNKRINSDISSFLKTYFISNQIGKETKNNRNTTAMRKKKERKNRLRKGQFSYYDGSLHKIAFIMCIGKTFNKLFRFFLSVYSNVSNPPVSVPFFFCFVLPTKPNDDTDVHYFYHHMWFRRYSAYWCYQSLVKLCEVCMCKWWNIFLWDISGGCCFFPSSLIANYNWNAISQLKWKLSGLLF